ncbi:transcriptional regulator [Pseudomonas sp. LS44]|uniref:helix-turn-helix transcriptional regulator n=1 Tax=Pseudomonas sp. LS44 TaxID=1357074 RepID=UPI00215AFECC|nr:metalloregulator ArsR/SmtB family transcription factor [Pseudomonas sp. LS44]UVE15985.1 transcriptional regulator [Pseudomonas sp. LS44]
MEMEAAMRVASKNAEAPGSGRDRVLFLLKRDGPQATAQVAQQLGVTAMAVRQHLSVLYGEGLVEFSDEQRKIGRPARIWRLTPKANARFPDHHAGLAVEMLQVVQSTFGEEGLERLTDGWTRKQVAAYRAQMPRQDLPLDQRVAALVRIRCEEGFMAECRPAQDGTIELVENHCAIAKAAHFCPRLCGGELTLFREVLGDAVTVERVEHFLAGDRRCTYRILANPSAS